MKNHYFSCLLFILLFIATGIGYADDVEIVNVVTTNSGNSSYRFDVTLKHADSGWDHYANLWEVLDNNGKVLGSRVLLHPHVNEQPFTRSLSAVAIPAGNKQVRIRARDSVHGFSTSEWLVDLE